MTPVLPLEISRKINNFLRPVEGFRLKAGQYHQCSFLYIVYITEVIENKNKLIIKGYKIFDEDENSFFEIITNKPKNRFVDFVYDEGYEDIDNITGDIVLEKETLMYNYMIH